MASTQDQSGNKTVSLGQSTSRSSLIEANAPDDIKKALFAHAQTLFKSTKVDRSPKNQRISKD